MLNAFLFFFGLVRSLLHTYSNSSSEYFLYDGAFPYAFSWPLVIYLVFRGILTFPTVVDTLHGIPLSFRYLYSAVLHG